VRLPDVLDEKMIHRHYVRIRCALEEAMGHTTRKQPTNVSIRSELLHRAKARNINLSKTLEESLETILKEQDRNAWMEENREAMEAANRFVGGHGLWSDGLRIF
jgi:antitoxin CcdA